MADYNALLEDLAQAVNGFIGASVVDLNSGMTLASKSTRNDFDLEVASAYNSEIVKGKIKTMQALNLQSDLEDILLSLTDQLHVIKVINPETFLYIAAEKDKTNLALLRVSIRNELAKQGL